MTINQRKLAFLEQASQTAPEYGQVLTLFKAIIAYIDNNPGATGLSFEPDLPEAMPMVQPGAPLVAARSMAVDTPRAIVFLEGLLKVMEQKSPAGTNEIHAIGSALEAGRLDLPLLFSACLQRERSAIEAAAATCGLQAPLLEFALETALKAALEPFASAFSEEDFGGWQHNTCPVCGSRAGMGELVGDEGRRYLCCSTCFFRWSFPRLACPYCGNDDSQSLTYFTVDDSPTRIDVCQKCSRYVKTRDSRKGHADVPLEAVDLATMHLDLVAGREGYERGR